MNYYSKYLIIVPLIIATIYPSLFAQSFADVVEENMDNLLTEQNVPGIAIAVIEDGSLVLKKGYGFADLEKSIPVTPQTGFNIGSVSKMFTAWGVMKLVESGRIELDSPVESHLTRWSIPDSEFDASKVTVRQLLSHTAGFSVHGYPGFPPEDELPTLEESLDGENGPIRANEPVLLINEPGTTFQYSGGGYTILQLIIEELTGQSFAKFMGENIFNPLSMSMTSFTLTDELLSNSATPYNEEGEAIYLERFTAQAAAGLHTNLDDLTLFIQEIYSGPSVISSDSFELMTTAVTETKGRYGLGHMAMKMGPVSVFGHAGSNDGWESGFFMHKETNSAIIILTNGSNGKNLGMSILRKWVQWKMSN